MLILLWMKWSDVILEIPSLKCLLHVNKSVSGRRRRREWRPSRELLHEVEYFSCEFSTCFTVLMYLLFSNIDQQCVETYIYVPFIPSSLHSMNSTPLCGYFRLVSTATSQRLTHPLKYRCTPTTTRLHLPSLPGRRQCYQNVICGADDIAFAS